MQPKINNIRFISKSKTIRLCDILNKNEITHVADDGLPVEALEGLLELRGAHAREPGQVADAQLGSLDRKSVV